MEVKGTAVKSINEYVKSTFPDRYKEWVESLPEGSRGIFDTAIYATTWYPVEPGAVVPTRTIAEIFFSGDYRKAAWESGRYSANSALSGGIYKFFVKASSPGFIISRANRVFTTYYRPCEMMIADTSSKHVVVQIKSPEKFEELVEIRIAGWMERALEISGCKELRMDISKSISKGDPFTQVDIHWI